MHTEFLVMLLFIPLTFFLVLALTNELRTILLRRAVLDLPNPRSLHAAPVPRGGGLAVLAVLIPLLAAAAFIFDSDARHGGLFIALILLAAISWLDDRKSLSVHLRLSAHVLAACLGSFSFPPDELLLNGLVPFWADRAILIIGWTWFINLYNFMDGIDGITGAETCCVAFGIFLVSGLAGINDPFLSILALCLVGASLGFLGHNWHPAKIFLGDVGSIPLGFLVGFGLISLAVKGHLAAAIILPLYYLSDSGLTLIRRAFRGDPVWKAHREHFYQKAALGAGSHSPVVMVIVAANVGLVAAAAISLSRPWTGIVLGFLIVAILFRKMHKTAVQPAIAQEHAGRV